MSKFDFSKFDSLCEQTLGNYGSVIIATPEQMPSTEPKLSEEALSTTAEWVTKRVLQDMDELLATG